MRPIPKPVKREKKPKPIKRSRIKPKPKATGEANLFKQIWSERPHICENCKGDLGHEAKAWFFSHRVRKSRGEKYRLDPENIDLHCLKCHELWDAKDERFHQRTGTNAGRYVGGLTDSPGKTHPAGQDQARRYFDLQRESNPAGYDRMANDGTGGLQDHRPTDQLEGPQHHEADDERIRRIPDIETEAGQTRPVQIKQAPDQLAPISGPSGSLVAGEPEPLRQNTNLGGSSNGR